MSILNRADERFSDFLKKYWWIELLIAVKVIAFINNGSYGIEVGILFLLGGLALLWVLYRAGLE